MANIPICASCGKVTRFVKENYCSDDCLITGLRARVAELERRDAAKDAHCRAELRRIGVEDNAGVLVNVHAEALQSRLTQLEGALRNLRNQVQGANAIAHHEILAAIGVTNARCIERALAEADAALTPVVKQEEP